MVPYRPPTFVNVCRNVASSKTTSLYEFVCVCMCVPQKAIEILKLVNFSLLLCPLIPLDAFNFYGYVSLDIRPPSPASHKTVAKRLEPEFLKKGKKKQSLLDWQVVFFYDS